MAKDAQRVGWWLVCVAQFQEDFLADVNLRGSVDDAAARSAVEDELIAFLVTDVLDGIVNFILNGCKQALALLVEFTFATKVLLLQIAGSLFFCRISGIGSSMCVAGYLVVSRLQHRLRTDGALKPGLLSIH